jgi:hypothetical protein
VGVEGDERRTERLRERDVRRVPAHRQHHHAGTSTRIGVLVTTAAPTRAERLRRLTLLQGSFDALPIDDEVAAGYGQLAATVVATGRQPRSRLMDLLIAATAVAHGARLYTRNASDLSGVEHLVEIVTV